MASIWKFLAGYVKIKLEGLKILQLVNEAAAQGILFRGAERQSYSRMTAEVSYRDYLRLCALARNRPLRVVVLTQGGLPLVVRAAARRMAFTIGLVLCIAALYGVNRFVLDVRVTGCADPALERRVLEVAAAQGLTPGAGKWTLDLRQCEKELMLTVRELSFAAVRVSGVRATIDVVEGVPAPELVDEEQPCHIIAAGDGIIRRMVVYDGTPKVAEGDVVRRGQVLVEGAEPLAEGTTPVHANAEILAGVWYEGRGSAPLYRDGGVKTGRVAERRFVEFAGRTVALDGGGEPGFAHYVTEESSRYLLGSGLKGPRLVTRRICEVLPATLEASPAEAMTAALAQAAAEATAKLPKGAQIRQQWTDYSIEDGTLRARMFIETLENIAVEVPVQ